jgi:Tol biopolymer transport system component
MRQRALSAALLALAIGSVTAVERPAQAQVGRQDDIPQIEPRFTRVFSSDTVGVMLPKVSPDGRWIVYAERAGAAATAELRLISVKGGEPIVLTSGKYDMAPHWFPTSDRIAFYSDAVDGVMTIAIDPRSGAPRGPAQRITLEPAAWPNPVSPDGRWIAYRVWANEGAEQGMALKIVPARGGNARTLIRLPRKPQLRFWSKDSRYVYFEWRDPADAPRKLWRVAIDGGAPQVVEKVSTGSSGPVLPNRLVPQGPTGQAGDVVYEIETLDERPLARVAVPRDMQVGDVTSNGRYLVAVASNVANPLRILPVEGGAMRQLGDGRSSDEPMGWTPDSRRIVYQTQLDGRGAVMTVPAEGGAAEEYAYVPNLPTRSYRTPVVLSESAQYLAFLRDEEDGSRTLNIARAADGEIREVADSVTALDWTTLTFPGGLPTKNDEFLYMAAHGDRRQLRAVSFEGHSRLIRSFPEDLGTRTAWGIFGDRVAWLEAAGDSVAICIADGPDAPARRLAVVSGLFDGLVFSPDGRWLAAAFYQNGEEPEHKFKILAIALTPDGKAASAPRFIDAPIAVAWEIRWLPDSRALTIFAQTLPDYGTDVWLFPIRDGGQPVAITRDETSNFWSYALSPDGRYIAYPGEIKRGSSLWMIDLGHALTSGGR